MHTRVKNTPYLTYKLFDNNNNLELGIINTLHRLVQINGAIHAYSSNILYSLDNRPTSTISPPLNVMQRTILGEPINEILMHKPIPPLMHYVND